MDQLAKLFSFFFFVHINIFFSLPRTHEYWLQLKQLISPFFFLFTLFPPLQSKSVKSIRIPQYVYARDIGNCINILFNVSKLIYLTLDEMLRTSMRNWWWAIFNLFYSQPKTFIHFDWFVQPLLFWEIGFEKKSRPRRSKISFCSEQMVHLSLFIYLFVLTISWFTMRLHFIFPIRINCLTRMLMSDLVPVVLFPSFWAKVNVERDKN